MNFLDDPMFLPLLDMVTTNIGMRSFVPNTPIPKFKYRVNLNFEPKNKLVPMKEFMNVILLEYWRSKCVINKIEHSLKIETTGSTSNWVHYHLNSYTNEARFIYSVVGL